MAAEEDELVDGDNRKLGYNSDIHVCNDEDFLASNGKESSENWTDWSSKDCNDKKAEKKETSDAEKMDEIIELDDFQTQPDGHRSEVTELMLGDPTDDAESTVAKPCFLGCCETCHCLQESKLAKICG